MPAGTASPPNFVRVPEGPRRWQRRRPTSCLSSGCTISSGRCLAPRARARPPHSPRRLASRWGALDIPSVSGSGRGAAVACGDSSRMHMEAASVRASVWVHPGHFVGHSPTLGWSGHVGGTNRERPSVPAHHFGGVPTVSGFQVHFLSSPPMFTCVVGRHVFTQSKRPELQS